MSLQPKRDYEPMTLRAANPLQSQIDLLDPTRPERTSQLVDLILADAISRSASDVHFEPTHRSVEVRYRIDGVLQGAAMLTRELAPNVVARLKVKAELLTYRLDIPQEGRIQDSINQHGVEMRVSTFPTIHGEKVVVRIFDSTGRTLDLEQLGLSDDSLDALKAMLRERTGAILLTGPSGSGKTTTIYACLRHLVRDSGGGRHIVTIEDPVEQAIEGVTQSQARPGHEFDFARGLRSLLRQDPEVIMIGEVRDPATASIAVEAALTGHLVISTLHAGSACGVVGRLMEMGVEPYLLTSGLKGILNQRLVRRLCTNCRQPFPSPLAPSAGRGAGGEGPFVATGCEHCSATGYRGRMLLAELLTLDDTLRRAILDKSDTATLEAATASSVRLSLSDAAEQAVAGGLTSRDEIARVLGPR
jgi:type II secretory ATPase GspE/PulE/Tfp pilus assembly ATPase PilB-like protein